MLAQLLAVVGRSLLKQGVERVVLARRARALLLVAALLVLHFYAGLARKFFHRLREFQAIEVHHEAERVAASAATKAVVELFVRADAERGRLFVMERAQRGVVLAGLLQFQARANRLDNVGTGEQVVNEALRDKSGHLPVCPVRQNALAGVRRSSGP